MCNVSYNLQPSIFCLLSLSASSNDCHRCRSEKPPRCFIQSMYDEGIVNDQFFQLQSMKEAIRRDYVVRAVTSFCVSCIRLSSTLTDQIYQQEVDFQKVYVLAGELHARTTGVGSENVKRVCAELLYASEMKDKNHCNQALYQIKDEFSYLRRRLETLVQATIVVASFGAVGWWCPGRLFRMGVVNDQFNEIVSLKNSGERDRVVQLIETYFADVDMILAELSRHVDNSKVDFLKLASLAREIEDKSASIGAEHMRLACSDLIKACDEKHQRSFSRTLPWLKNEFTSTRNKLDAFVQMERRIIRLESSQSQSPN